MRQWVVGLLLVCGPSLALARSPVDSFGRDYARLIAQRSSDCLGGTLRAWSQHYPPDRYGAWLDEGVRAHRLTFVAKQSTRCLARLRSASCVALEDAIQACDQVFQGALPPGAACQHVATCAHGVCLGTETVGGGRCQPFAAEGAACDAAPCDSNHVCDSATRVCKPRGGDGAVCRDNDSCAEAFFCLQSAKPSGLKITATLEGVCRPRRAAKEGCERDGDCLSGHRCQGNEFDGPGQCTPLPLAKVGQRCSADSHCGPMATCREGVCAAGPGLGEPCNAVRGTVTFCEEGYCEAGTCKPFAALGAPCASHEMCGLTFVQCQAGHCIASP
jgi:hypothetical protein